LDFSNHLLEIIYLRNEINKGKYDDL